MKEFKTGMVLGKFYPPHNGHLFLIDTAAEQCDTLYVLCCSLKNEKISGLLRWEWLSKIYGSKPNVKIIHVTDENPQHPEKGKEVEFYNIWYKTVYNNIPVQLDAVFTSEDYGDEFADSLKCKHILVDKERIKVPVSGTLIRTDCFNHWDKIPEEVRGYFTKKVVIVGPESTGKTTLSERLAKFFNGGCVPEYGRTYTEDMEDLSKLEIADFERIAFGHVLDVANPKFIEGTEKKLLFVDTEAITTKVFGNLYLGNEYQSNDIDKMIETQEFDLWLLLDIDVPYVQDGNRLPESNRVKHFEMLKAELGARNIKYVLLSGDFEQRYENAKNEAVKLLN